MMINWAEKKRLKTVKQTRRHYRRNTARSQEKFLSPEDEQEQRDNLELLQAVTIQREDDSGRSQETVQRPVGRAAEPVKTCMTSLQGMQDLRDGP